MTTLEAAIFAGCTTGIAIWLIAAALERLERNGASRRATVKRSTGDDIDIAAWDTAHRLMRELSLRQRAADAKQEIRLLASDALTRMESKPQERRRTDPRPD